MGMDEIIYSFLSNFICVAYMKCITLYVLEPRSTPHLKVLRLYMSLQ